MTTKTNGTPPKKSYTYECEFNFFFGDTNPPAPIPKIGYIEITTDGLLTREEIETLKNDKLFKESIEDDFNKFFNIKDAYKIAIRSIKLKPKKKKTDP